MATHSLRCAVAIALAPATLSGRSAECQAAELNTKAVAVSGTSLHVRTATPVANGNDGIVHF